MTEGDTINLGKVSSVTALSMLPGPDPTCILNNNGKHFLIPEYNMTDFKPKYALPTKC